MKLPLAWLTPWNTRCGVAEYSRQTLAALSLELMPLVLAERCQPEELVGVERATVIRCWPRGEERRGAIIGGRALGSLQRSQVALLHVQFEGGLYHPTRLISDLQRVKKKGLRIVMTVHSSQVGRDFPGSLADVTIATNAVCASQLAAWGWPRVFHIPLGIDQYPPLIREEARQRHGLQPGPVVASFGMMGRQQLDVVFRLVRELAPAYPGLKYLLLSARRPGDRGEGRQRLLALGESFGLADRLILVDNYLDIGQVIARLAAADFLVLWYPSSKLMISSAAARVALATHRPLVVNANPFFADLGQAVVRCHHFEELLETSRQLLAGTFDLTETAAQVEILIQEQSWAAVAAAHHQIYSELI